MIRRISPCFRLYQYAEYSLQHRHKSYCNVNQAKIINHTFKTNHALLMHKSSFQFSTDTNVETQTPKLVVPFKGEITVRNSQNMDLSFDAGQKVISFLIGKNSTVEDVCQLIKEKLNASNAYFVCEQAKTISGLTPFQALLDRTSFAILNDDYSVRVDGQLLRSSAANTNKENFKNLQLPLVTRRDIENYTQRVNTWIESKYGAGFQNTSIRIPKNQVKKILVQALLDPQESSQRMLSKQQQFQRMYWQVQQLLDKKNQAAVQCSKMVRNRMSLGVFMILANVGFIWSGTYIFYSWDIIEPIAYFISSMAGIVLCSRFFKIRRPFSLLNYKQYMIQKYMPKAMQKVGLDINELNTKKLQLAELQSQIKDYYLKRL